MRWYIISQGGDCRWRITSWSRSKILASHKAVREDGHSVYAANRKRAAVIAKTLHGIDVDWRKY